MYKLILLFAFLATAHAQLISDGQCDLSALHGHKSKQMKSTDVDATTFFEIDRIKNNWNIGFCTSYAVTASIATGISISMKEVVNRKLIERNATVTADEHFEIFNVVFPDFNSNFTFIGRGEKFAVLYACSNVGNKKQEYAWVLSPNTTLTETDKKAARTIIELNKLNEATWVENSHTPDACKSGGTNNIKLSQIIVLIFGFLVSKGL